MAILRWRDVMDPFSELDDLRSSIDRLFGDFISRPWGVVRYRGVFPPLNITEDADNLYVRAELPGINPKEIEVTATADSLTVRGERKEPKVEEEVDYHQREREFGTFRRIISLPVKVDADKISASYMNGILTVVLPKAEEAKPKQIEVKTA